MLLTYALFDEFMVVLTRKLGRARGAVIKPSDLRDRGIRRYEKFIHKVCQVSRNEAEIDWGFFRDFAVVRNAIIHANGNQSLARAPQELEQIAMQRMPLLSFKHKVKVVVTQDFVQACIAATHKTALSVNALVADS